MCSKQGKVRHIPEREWLNETRSGQARSRKRSSRVTFTLVKHARKEMYVIFKNSTAGQTDEILSTTKEVKDIKGHVL